MAADARTRVTEIVSGLDDTGGERLLAEELLPLAPGADTGSVALWHDAVGISPVEGFTWCHR